MLKFKDLYTGKIDLAEVSGCEVYHDNVMLEIIEKPPVVDSDDLSSILGNNTNLLREPVLFRVLGIGPAVTGLKVNDIVCISLLAGDRFAESPILVVKFRDVMFRWGDGIYE
jgi:hypothetical protein